MLSVEFEGVDRYRLQAETVRVSGRCGCGCLTIDFAHPATDDGETLLSEARDSVALIMLFATGGQLSCLEYAPTHDDVSIPAEFPLPPDLRCITAGTD